MEEIDKEKYFQEFIKTKLNKNLQSLLKNENITKISKLEHKSYKEIIENCKSAYLLIQAINVLDYEFVIFITEKSADLLTKKNLNQEQIYNGLIALDGGLASGIFLKQKKAGSEDERDLYFLSPLRSLKKYPDEISEEVNWISDRGYIYFIECSTISFYIIIKEESYNKILFDVHNKFKSSKILQENINTGLNRILVFNSYEFILGRYILPFIGKTKQYDVEIKFNEILHFNSLNITVKIGICYKHTIQIGQKKYEFFYFIHLNSQAEVKSYSVALMDIFNTLTSNNIEFLKDRFQENIVQDLIIEIPFESLSGKKLTLFKSDLRVSKNHLPLFVMLDPQYFSHIAEKSLTEFDKNILKKTYSVPQIIFNLNLDLIHKEKDKYAEYAYPITDIDLNSQAEVKKLMILARFFNLIDSRDLMVLIQNYFIQNYKTSDLVGLFFYSIINKSTNTKKNVSLPEFDEKRFVSYLVGVHIEEFQYQKTQEAKPIETLYDHNLKLFLELNLAIKNDKVVITEKAKHIFYNIFMSYYLQSKKNELEKIGELNEYIKDVKAFHKKFASDMVAELSKEVVCLSYIDNRELVDFLTSFMSKNRKDQIFEDYQYFKKQYKDKKIDILDVYENRKILFEKYKNLKQALIDEGMI